MTRIRFAALLGALALLTAGAATGQAPQAKDNPGLDRHGDTLPAGALARLGTVRFRVPATAMAYSPDGSLLAVGGSDNQIRLLEAATGKEVRRLAGHQPRTFSPPRDPKSAFDLLVDSTGRGSVTTLAFSHDGKTLASGGWDDMVRLWDVQTGKELRKMLAHQAMVARVAFSPDDRTLASRGGIDGVLRLWDPMTGAELRKVEKLHRVNPWRFYREAALAFSPDSKTVAVSDNKGVVLIGVATGKETGRIDGYRDCMYVAFAPGGKLIATGGLDDAAKESYSLRFWDAATRKEAGECDLPKTKKGGTEPPTCFAFSPEGDKLIAAIAEMDTYVFEVPSGKQLQHLGHHWAYRVAYAPDGKTVVSLRGPALRLWDPANGKERFLHFAGHQTGVMAVAVSPDGKLTASAGENIRLWETTTGKAVRTLPGAAVTLAFSPDGKTLVSGGGTSVRLWDVDTGKELRKLDGPRLVRSVVFSPNGKLLATGDEQATIRILEAGTGKQLHEMDLQALAESVCLVFSPDSKTLACAGGWNQFNVGKVVLDIQGRVKVKSRDGYFVLLWDADTGKEVRKFAGLVDNIKAVAFSADGKTLAGSSRDGRLVLWDVETGKDRLHILAHPAAAPGAGTAGHIGSAFAATPALCFAPDGTSLLSASPDGTIRQWDTTTAREIGRFYAPDGGFSALAMTRDGAMLVSGSPDTTVLVWDVKMAAKGLQLKPAAPKAITIGLAR
jgi:WD40 repeat protein